MIIIIILPVINIICGFPKLLAMAVYECSFTLYQVFAINYTSGKYGNPMTIRDGTRQTYTRTPNMIMEEHRLHIKTPMINGGVISQAYIWSPMIIGGVISQAYIRTPMIIGGVISQAYIWAPMIISGLISQAYIWAPMINGAEYMEYLSGWP